MTLFLVAEILVVALSLLALPVVELVDLGFAVEAAALGPLLFPLAGRLTLAWAEVAWALAWRAMVDTYWSAMLRRVSIRWPRARLVKSGKGSVNLVGGDGRTRVTYCLPYRLR